MRVNCWRSCASNASRLRRRFASSAFTMTPSKNASTAGRSVRESAPAPRRSRACASARSTSASMPRQRFVQRLLRGLAQQSPTSTVPRGARLRLLEDVGDALVGRGEAGGLGQREERHERVRGARRNPAARPGSLARTASNISVLTSATLPRCRVEKIRAQPLDDVVPELVGRGRARHGLQLPPRAPPARAGRDPASSRRGCAARRWRRAAGRTDPWCRWASGRWRRCRRACRACRPAPPRCRRRVAGNAPPAPRGM